LRARVDKLNGSAESRRELADYIAAMAVEYVRQQVQERPAHLLAERAFQQEALLNPRLHDLVRAHRQILQQGATHFFEVLGSQQPEQDAKVLTGIVERMEYQGLIDGAANLDGADMLAILKRYMYMVLGL
jgi:DNA-binding transcriptional regulator YbjK